MSTIVDSNTITKLEQFYSVGASIREKNNEFELPWSENKDIHVFLDENDVNYQLLVLETAGKQGRLMAYQFLDSPEKGYLGWYECDNDDELAKQLLNQAENWLKSQGAESLNGPMNGSSWGTFRFNNISSKPLFVTEPYQPLYYVKQWENFGFTHDVVYETHLVPKEISRPMPVWQVKLLSFIKGVKFQKWPKGMANDDIALKNMFEFFIECFGENPLYRSITFEKYKEITLKLENILDFDHSYIMYDKKTNKPASVLISYKDVFHQMYKEGKLKDEAHNTHTLYMKTIATAKAWRGKHLSRVLVNFGFVQALKNDYQEVVFGTMMAQNKSAQYSKSFFQAKPLREYSFMKKVLST